MARELLLFGRRPATFRSMQAGRGGAQAWGESGRERDVFGAIAQLTHTCLVKLLSARYGYAE